MKVFLSIISILGSIIGPGMIGGKEIAIFFSRFGKWSFVGILLAFFAFFFLFKTILNCSHQAKSKLENSKVYCWLGLIVAIIFSSAMFGGIINLIDLGKFYLNFLFYLLILFICFIIFKKGIKFLSKINLILLPILIVCIVVGIGGQISCDFVFENCEHGHFAVFYCMLYVLLNVSNGSVIIIEIGKDLSQKQKTRVAFFSALVLCGLLFVANIVLLQNPSSLLENMPFLTLFEGVGQAIMTMIILIGSLSTLFSSVYSSSSLLRQTCKNDYLVFLIGVGLPAVISLIGFGKIVEFCYPIASVFGACIIAYLFFISFFKRSDNKIHCGRKKA